MPAALPTVRVRYVRAALFAGGALAFGYLLVSAHVPCAFASLFGLPCPGCGSTRAMLALALGDLRAVVRYNPVAPLAAVVVLAYAVQALASLLATGTLDRVGQGRLGALILRVALVAAVLEFLVWVGRFGGLFGGLVPV